MAKEKLKPCPFCGGEGILEKSYGGFSKPVWEVYHNCSLRKWAICKGDTKKEVISAWNKRTHNQ